MTDTAADAAPAADEALIDSVAPASFAGMFSAFVRPDSYEAPVAPAANDASALDLDDGGIVRGDANTRLRRVIGPRLFKARVLSALGQAEAANLLGYGSSAQLNLWEQCRRLPPLSEVVKAANLYSVPVDFLLGVSDSTDRDPALALRHAVLNGVRNQLERVAEITVDQVARHARLVGPTIGTVSGLVAAGDSLLDAIQTFCRLNHEALEDMRGGATLVRLAEDFEAELLGARKAIRLHDSLDGDLRRALAAIGSSDPLPGDSEKVD